MEKKFKKLFPLCEELQKKMEKNETNASLYFFGSSYFREQLLSGNKPVS